MDDLNLVGTIEELTRTATYLKNEFKMKDLDRTKFCLGIHVEHLSSGFLSINPHTLKKFSANIYRDKAHLLTTPILIVRSHDVDKDPLIQPQENEEEILRPEVSYLSTIGALMFLATTIELILHSLSTYNSTPTRRH